MKRMFGKIFHLPAPQLPTPDLSISFDRKPQKQSLFNKNIPFYLNLTDEITVSIDVPEYWQNASSEKRVKSILSELSTNGCVKLGQFKGLFTPSNLIELARSQQNKKPSQSNSIKNEYPIESALKEQLIDLLGLSLLHTEYPSGIIPFDEGAKSQEYLVTRILDKSLASVWHQDHVTFHILACVTPDQVGTAFISAEQREKLIPILSKNFEIFKYKGQSLAELGIHLENIFSISLTDCSEIAQQAAMIFIDECMEEAAIKFDCAQNAEIILFAGDRLNTVYLPDGQTKVTAKYPNLKPLIHATPNYQAKPRQLEYPLWPRYLYSMRIIL
jgi:hypothetical protein